MSDDVHVSSGASTGAATSSARPSKGSKPPFGRWSRRIGSAFMTISILYGLVRGELIVIMPVALAAVCFILFAIRHRSANPASSAGEADGSKLLAGLSQLDERTSTSAVTDPAPAKPGRPGRNRDAVVALATMVSMGVVGLAVVGVVSLVGHHGRRTSHLASPLVSTTVPPSPPTTVPASASYGTRTPTPSEDAAIRAAEHLPPNSVINAVWIADTDATWAADHVMGGPGHESDFQPYFDVLRFTNGEWTLVPNSGGTARIDCDASVPPNVILDFADVLGPCDTTSPSTVASPPPDPAALFNIVKVYMAEQARPGVFLALGAAPGNDSFTSNLVVGGAVFDGSAWQVRYRTVIKYCYPPSQPGHHEVSDMLIPGVRSLVLQCYDGGNGGGGSVLVLAAPVGHDPRLYINVNCGQTDFAVSPGQLIIHSGTLREGQDSPSQHQPDVVFNWDANGDGFLPGPGAINNCSRQEAAQ